VDVSDGVTGIDRPLATIRLYLYVENNNRHLRGKKRAIDNIVRYVLPVLWRDTASAAQRVSDKNPVP